MKAIHSIGRYRVEGLLGTGAMGEVYRAYDPLIDRMVAIKVVRPDLATGSGSDQWLQRFRREARAAGRRFHPNIIAILDFGEDHGMSLRTRNFAKVKLFRKLLRQLVCRFCASSQNEKHRVFMRMDPVLSSGGNAHHFAR